MQCFYFEKLNMSWDVRRGHQKNPSQSSRAKLRGKKIHPQLQDKHWGIKRRSECSVSQLATCIGNADVLSSMVIQMRHYIKLLNVASRMWDHYRSILHLPVEG